MLPLCGSTKGHELKTWSCGLLRLYIKSKRAHLMINHDHLQKYFQTISLPIPPNKNERMTATGRYGSDPNNHPDQKELSNIMRNLKSSSDGTAAFVMGTDGVLRTLTIDYDVIDAIGLPPRLIKAFLDRDVFNQNIEDMFRGADGTKVTQEQWWRPDPSLLPPPLTAEQKAWIKKTNEENKEIIQENIRKMESGELKPCGVVIRSDYDISPR